MGNPVVEAELKASRDLRIRVWTEEGKKTEEVETWADVVWWGYFDQTDDDETHPPAALFPTETAALAYAQLVGKFHEWDVLPCVLRIDTRNNFQVPE
jgi:hypothetical protein